MKWDLGTLMLLQNLRYYTHHIWYSTIKKIYPNQILRTRSQHNDEFPTMWFAILKIEVPL